MSNSTDHISLYDYASGAAAAPAATAELSVRSQWQTRDAAARLAIRSHLPLAELEHFGDCKTAKALYDAVVARYSSPATAELSRLMRSYLFPDLSTFATVADLITHLRTSDARLRAALPTEFCAKNPPPLYWTLHFIVTRLPDTLSSVRDYFLARCPTELTVALLEEKLLAAEKSIVAVGAARGAPRTPIFEGCSPSPLAPSYATAAAVDFLGAESAGAASAPGGRRRTGKGKGGKGGGGGARGEGGGGGGGGGGAGGSGGGSAGGSGAGGGGGGGGGSSGGGGSGGGGGGGGSGGGGGGGGGRSGGSGGGGGRSGGTGSGQSSQQQQRPQSTQQLREWLAQRGTSGGSGRCSYVIRTGDRKGQTCGKFHTQYRCFFRLDDAWREEMGEDVERPRWAELMRAGVDIFALDYDAIIAAMYALTVSAEGDCYLCVPPDPGIEPAALGASESALSGMVPPVPAPSSAVPAVCESALSGTAPTETALSGTAPAEACHTFTLDSVLAQSTTVLPCPAVPSGSLTCFHLPSFSTNLTLLWHHRLGHPSLPRLRGMHRRHLVSGLPRSLPPLPASPAPPCLPCVEGRQRAAPHSSSFPPTEAPLQTLHLDVWGPARVRGQGGERYFLLVVDDYSRYTTVFPLRTKGEVPAVLIPWIRTVRLQLRRRFRTDLPVLRLHSDRGGEFSSDLLRTFCQAEGIEQTFTLPDSPQQNGVAERRIGLVMEVARTSLVHAAAPHFLWPFAVRYAVHQLNLWPRVSLPETSPTLRWTGRLAMRRASGCGVLVPLSAIRLRTSSPPARFPVSSLALSLTRLAGSFTTPPRAGSSPLRMSPLTSRSLFTVSSPTALPPSPPTAFPCSWVPFPLPPQGPAPSGVSQVDPPPVAEPVEVTGDSGAAAGGTAGSAEPGGAEPAGAGPGSAGTAGAGAEGGAEPACAESGGAESGGAEPAGTEPGGAAAEPTEPRVAASGGAPVRGAEQSLTPQQLRDWYVRRFRRPRGSAGVGGAGAARPGGTGAGDSGAGGASGVGAAASGGTLPSGAADPGGGAAAGAADPPGGAAAGAEDPSGGAAAGAGDPDVGAPAGTEDPAAGVSSASGDAARPRPYFVPLLQQVLGQAPPPCPPPSVECPPPVQPQSQLPPASPLPAPSPYTGPTGGLTERREPESRPASPVRTARTGSRVRRERPPPVPGTHYMTLRPSTAPQRVPLPSPPASSLPAIPDPESDRYRAEHPTVTRLLATVVTDPTFESSAASALVAELVDFAAACRLDYAARLVAGSESASVCPPSVGGECALGTDVLEDRQEDFDSLAAAVPHLVAWLLAPEGDPDALDIPTPRTYAEAISGPYSSQWQTAMDAEMASWKSTGTYVDEVPPPGANIVDGMWIFRVKRPPGSPSVFKARYVARGFSQRQGVDFFQTFSPTPKMTTLRVLLHVAAQRDYELHSLDFSTAFLQGSLHEEIWLRRPPGFTGSFPPGTQWSLRRPVYGLRQAPREWHDTLRTTLAALGFAPSTADPSLFLRTDTSLPPFYILVYVDDLVFATADTEALARVKSELQKRHTCTDLGELRSYLGLQITRDRARRTITLTQSHMVQQVLQRFGFQFSSPQATPLATSHSLSAPPPDESVEPSGPYPELVGCLMYLMTCTRPDLAYPLSILARYVAPGRHRREHWEAAKRVLRYLCSTSGMGLVLGGRDRVVLIVHSDASWVDDLATQRSSQGYTFSLGSGSVSWRSTRSSSVLGSSCEAEIYATAMAAQELRWLTYLLTDLGERPSSPPVLYGDNKAALALCQEHRLEHRTKHIALRYFLARELQQRGQLRLVYVDSKANTADIFTKALPPSDHQRHCTSLGLVSTFPHLLTA
ncbi:unnamed protein product [Closterium sp. Yama58-4]|nr:unnamed protein product [Closterium sp. Yama58-4]